MEIPAERLPERVADGPLLPAWLVAGPEPLLVLEAADAIRARARAEGIGEREVFDMEARAPDWDALAASLAAPGLFSPRRLIEVRLPGGKPGKDGAELIAGFCANPPTDVVLLVVAGEWSKAHHGKWVDAIDRIGVVSIAWQIKPHQVAGWVQARLRSRGVQADRDAVALLAERVEGNLLAAAQEVDKLALLADGRTLDAGMLASLVADAARFDVFRLAEVALSGQPALAARMLAGLRAEGEQVAGLMPMLVRELLRCAHLARVAERGGNLAAEMKAQGLWESRQAPFKRALQRHPASARWDRFVAAAGRVDRIAKGRGQGDAWVVLERLLLAVADTGAVRLVA